MSTYTTEQAEKDILAYLTGCGTRWFRARHTDLAKVMSNKRLIARLGQEHIRNMELSGMGPTASAKVVCDEDMTGLPEFK